MMRLRVLLQVGIGERAGREQRDGIRVLRIRVDLVAGANLDDVAEIHDGDASC